MTWYNTLVFWMLWTARSMFITAVLAIVFSIMAQHSIEEAVESKKMVDKLFLWAVKAFIFSFIAFVGGIITIVGAVALFQLTVFLFF